MSCGIYKITNTINGHAYVGQSICIENRWADEKARAFNPNSESYNSTLSKAFRKYGVDNFTFEILEMCSREQLNEKEKEYIALYDTYRKGYNATTGGDGTPNLTIKLSDEQVKEIYHLLKNTDIPQKIIAQRYNVGQDVISTINHGKSRYNSDWDYPIRNNKKEKQYCIDCGIEVTFGALRCNICEKKRQRRTEWPSREELKTLVRMKSFAELGRFFGVSDNTIRKWCVYYNIPNKKKDIISYPDEEWELV